MMTLNRRRKEKDDDKQEIDIVKTDRRKEEQEDRYIERQRTARLEEENGQKDDNQEIDTRKKDTYIKKREIHTGREAKSCGSERDLLSLVDE